MRLYTFQHSPSPLKARLALAELELAYEPIEVNLFRGEHRAEAFAKVNPHGKVPVLEDGALLLRESNAILIHLGRKRPTPRWPASPGGEARALQWLFFEAAHLATPCGTVWWTDVVAPKVGRAGAAEPIVNHAVEELERALDVLEHELGGGAFLLGAEPSLADCAVGVAAVMLQGSRLDDAARWPRVAAYRERVRARPSWAQARGDAILRFEQSEAPSGA